MTTDPALLINWLLRCLDLMELDTVPLTPVGRRKNRPPRSTPEQRYIADDIAAKRRIVTRHRPEYRQERLVCVKCARRVDWPCAEIRDAAYPFRDRDGYDKEWLPT